MITQIKTGQLSQKAMIVHLTLSEWTSRTKDKIVTQETCKNKGAKGDAGSWWTRMVSASDLRPVHSAKNSVDRVFKKYTLPWSDGGYRILASKLFMSFRKEFRLACDHYDKAIVTFVKDVYPKIRERAEAQKRLGKLADSVVFPTPEEVKAKFGYSVEILPLPTAGDFRMNLNKSELDTIKKEYEESFGATLTTAMADVWGRLNKLVSKVVERLDDPETTFRDTLISKLKDFVEFMPNLNFMEDEKLEEIRREVKTKLANLKPIDLREDKKGRKEAVKKAKAILKKMEGYNF